MNYFKYDRLDFYQKIITLLGNMENNDIELLIQLFMRVM